MISTISTTPLETVQIISMISYLNTLSDFLYNETLLQEQDLYKKIPVVNALYDFFSQNQDNPDKKMVLVRKLLEGSDLYGENENETVDIKFVNTMFDHIIGTFVFEEYGNIYGFLADVVRTSENITRDSLIFDIRNILLNLTFDNEYGNNSVLMTLSVEYILTDLIIPLFPLSKNDHSILSVDFIYAQAGLTFLRTGQTKHGYFPHLQNLERNFINHKTIFDQYILVGHTIENLVQTKKINESTLSVFSLPALLNYVYREKNNLKNFNIQKIITDPKQWTKAYIRLFSYLQFTFTKSIKALDDDYRYQLHVALAHFKNRTMLARDLIKTNCSYANENDMEKKVSEYVKKVYAYGCEKDFKQVSLPDLNRVYDSEISDTGKKYFQYEQESIREAFGQSLIDSVNQNQVVILRGSFIYEQIDPANDLLEFYYSEEEKTIFYALIRKDHNVSLIKEEDDPILFRQKLNVNINEPFTKRGLNDILKKWDEDFDQFLFNIVTEKRQQFQQQFHSMDFGQERSNWWKEFGISLIPFYSCITNSLRGAISQSLISCPMDTMLLFSAVGELEDVASKIITFQTQDSFSKWGVTLKTISSREFVQNLINTEVENLESENFKSEILHLPNILDSQIYERLGQVSTRFNNRGMELNSIIGIDEFTSIQKIIRKVRNVARLPLRPVSLMLLKAKKKVSGSVWATDEIFFEHTVNVKGIEANTNTGYGYKFIYLPYEQTAEIRHVHEFEDELLVKYLHTTNKKEIIYKEVDAETMSIKEQNLYLKNDGLLVRFLEPEPNAIHIPLYNAGNCFSERRKRNIEENVYCPRTPILQESFERLQTAINYIQETEDLEDSRIRHVITSFYFPPGGKTEMDFVEDWQSRDHSFPFWSEKHRISQHDLFYDLRFKKCLDSEKITSDDAKERIALLYSQNDLDRIIITAKYMRSKFFEHKVHYSLRFEDYFAIGNQQGLAGSGGYMRLGENTDEARRMRNALYRLAIRQHFDPIDEFPQKLYRGEKRPNEVIDKLFMSDKDFSFGRFSSASRSKEIAIDFASKGKSKDPKVLYEINFTGRYMRAKVEKVYATNQEESVLLPHHKFRIVKVKEEFDEKLGDYLKVVLQHQREDPLDEMKNVLKEIKKLMKSGTRFYSDEKPNSFMSKLLSP